MTDAPLQALFEVLASKLGSSAYPSSVDADVARPYTVFSWAGGGRERMRVRAKNARYTISVKRVADTLEEALAGNETISAALDDSGSQDYDPRLPSHPDWEITTGTEDREIFLEEAFEGAVHIYHSGHQYVFTMERRN